MTEEEIVFDNIESLDLKYSIDFLNEQDIEVNNYTKVIECDNINKLLIVKKFFTKRECSKLIKSIKNHNMEELSFRDSSRIIGFDKNKVLSNLIKTRLRENEIIDKINSFNVKPYGFSTESVNWNPNTTKINNCFRFNEYTNSKKVKYHRDAQYCESKFIKSNFTCVLYLNDDYEGGELIFKIPKKKFIQCGYTIEEELNLINQEPYQKIAIKPKTGTLIIFDQRLLHKANKVKGTKYIIRTELICEGTEEIDNSSNLEKKIELLTKRIFRQAQYYELKLKQNLDKDINKKCTELYEICLNLRQEPSKIKKYPVHLESLLQDIPENVFLGNSLKLISRNGSGCKFSYKGNNKLFLIKICSLYSFLTCTQSLTNLNTKIVFKDILDIMKIDNQLELETNLNNKFEKKGEKELHSELEKDSDYNKKIDKNYLKNFDEFSDVLSESDIIYKKYYKQYDFLKYFENKELQEKENENNFSLQFSCNSRDYVVHSCLCPLGNKNILIVNYEKFCYKEQFALNFKEFEFSINNLEIYKKNGVDVMKGDLSFNTIINSFNHASCQCEGGGYISFSSKKSEKRLYKSVTVNTNFKVEQNCIIINLYPGIAM